MASRSLLFPKSRLPLKVVYCRDGRPDKVVDAKGRTVIETDSGYYGPSRLDAERICYAVNTLAHGEEG